MAQLKLKPPWVGVLWWAQKDSNIIPLWGPLTLFKEWAQRDSNIIPLWEPLTLILRVGAKGLEPLTFSV